MAGRIARTNGTTGIPGWRGAGLAAIAVGLLVAMLLDLGSPATKVPTAAAQGEARYGELIVVQGEDLPELIGLPVSGLVALDAEGRQQPLQVDERRRNDDYVAEEDGTLDANDELVLLADSLGPRAPEGSRLIQGSYYELAAADPLNGNSQYLYLAAGSPEADLKSPSLAFLPDTGAIAAEAYDLVFASPVDDGFVGPKSLSFAGSTKNLIDRFKVRITIKLLGFLEEVYDEERLSREFGGDANDPPVKLGALRIVLGESGYDQASAKRVSLFAGNWSGSVPGGATISNAELMLDLSPEALGGSYRDEHRPDGVSIDAMPDAGLDGQLPRWREYRFPDGRWVLLSEDTALESDADQTYADGDSAPEDDTGDGRLIGQIGVKARNARDYDDADFPGQIVFLPGDHPLSAETLSEQFRQPLELSLSESLAVAPDTPTPEPPPPTQPAPELSPTPSGERFVIQLPLLARSWDPEQGN